MVNPHGPAPTTAIFRFRLGGVCVVCVLAGELKESAELLAVARKGSAELLRALQNFLTRQELLLFAKWAPDLRDVNVVAVSLLVTL